MISEKGENTEETWASEAKGGQREEEAFPMLMVETPSSREKKEERSRKGRQIKTGRFHTMIFPPANHLTRIRNFQESDLVGGNINV